MSETKKFLYINRKAPYGTIYAWESLEVVLIGAAFEQDVSLAFLDDGVFQLTKGQDTKGIGMWKRGMAVFTLAKGGLMYEATLAGQKYKFKPLQD